MARLSIATNLPIRPKIEVAWIIRDLILPLLSDHFELKKELEIAGFEPSTLGIPKASMRYDAKVLNFKMLLILLLNSALSWDSLAGLLALLAINVLLNVTWKIKCYKSKG